MNFESVSSIARSVLYEGYILYPYGASSLKNRQRWSFGGLFPQTYSQSQATGDPWFLQSECLIRGRATTQVCVQACFLQLVSREVGRIHLDQDFEIVDFLEVGEQTYVPWEEAEERTVQAEALSVEQLQTPQRTRFSFSAQRQVETLLDPVTRRPRGALIRERQRIEGEMECQTYKIKEGLYKLSVQVRNISPFELSNEPEQNLRKIAALQSMASSHLLLGVEGGQFLSLTDPPADVREASAECRNVTTWPVLVGRPHESNQMLSSPIILYDFPKVAPESQGDLFDATEIDEILSLRILTLSDTEKSEMRGMGSKVRSILERTENLSAEEFKNLHGRLQKSSSTAFSKGQRVRLKPKASGDVFDIVLQGKIAVIEGIERDFEDQIYFSVTIEDDPGQDLGKEGKPGHRFYFRLDEVEAL